MRVTVLIGGVPVAVEADDAERWAAVDALFGGCPHTDATPVLTVRFAREAVPLPTGPPDVAYPDIELWFRSGWLAGRSSTGLTAVRDGDRITVGGTATDSDTGRAFRRSVQDFLVDALAAHGRHALHAAALARDGRALIAVGPTGAGKSTLSYAAGGAERGWRVLTDDFVWITVHDESVAVSGLPKPLQVPANTLQEPPDGARRLEGDARDRWVLPRDLVALDERVPAIGLILIQHADGAGHLEPRRAGPALLTELVQAHPLAASADRVRAFFPVAGALSRLPVLVLRHDADPSKRVAAAVELLEQAWDHFTNPLAQ